MAKNGVAVKLRGSQLNKLIESKISLHNGSDLAHIIYLVHNQFVLTIVLPSLRF